MADRGSTAEPDEGRAAGLVPKPDRSFKSVPKPEARSRQPISVVVVGGGGSRPVFQDGPAVGEVVAALVLDEATPDPRFSLERFATPPIEGWQLEWF